MRHALSITFIVRRFDVGNHLSIHSYLINFLANQWSKLLPTQIDALKSFGARHGLSPLQLVAQSVIFTFILAFSLVAQCQLSIITFKFAYLKGNWSVAPSITALNFAYLFVITNSHVKVIQISAYITRFSTGQARAISAKIRCNNLVFLVRLTCNWCPFLSLNLRGVHAWSSYRTQYERYVVWRTLEEQDFVAPLKKSVDQM